MSCGIYHRQLGINTHPQQESKVNQEQIYGGRNAAHFIEKRK